jgi:PAS domain S-box-containing protein
MTKDTFVGQTGKARERIEALRQRAKRATTGQNQRKLLSEALKELSVNIEELVVAREQLHRQNQELAVARQALEDERQRSQELSDLIPNAYLVTDALGVIREANLVTAALLSVPQGLLEGKPLIRFVAEQDRKAFAARLTRLSGIERLEEKIHLQPRGKKAVLANVTMTTVHNSEGEVIGLRWLVRDVAERRQQRTLVQLESFPELNPNPVIEVGLNGHLYYQNSAARELFPDLQTAGIQHSWLEGLESVAKILKGRESNAAVRETKMGDVWYEQMIYSVMEGERFRIYGLDISERKRIEAALRKSEQRERQRAAELETVLQAVPAAVWIAHDPDCHHITGNPTSDELLRLPSGAESSLSAPAPLRPKHFKAMKDEQEMALDELPVQRAARGVPVRDFEFSLAFTDGTVRHLLGNATPLFDELRRPRGSVATFVDITDRKEAEKKLRESERKYRELYEGTQDGFVIVDMEGRIKEFNQAYVKMLGYSVEDLMALTYKDLTPRRWHVMEAEIVENQVLPNGYSGVYEKEYKRKDGTSFPVSLRTYLMRDAKGQPTGMWAFVRDITKRKWMEDELQKSNRRLEIISEVASELLMTAAPQDIVKGLCKEVMSYLGCDTFFNFLVDEEKGRLRLNAYAGIPEDVAKNIEWLDFGVAVCGCAARDGCRIVVENIPETSDPRTDLVKSVGIKAYASHPLMSRGRVIGTLSFGTRSRLSFSEEELGLMKTVADHVAMAMERMILVESLSRSRDELEIRVQERTTELAKANKELRAEITARQRTEEALQKLTDELNERIKEVNCLYTVSYHIGNQHLPLEERLRRIVISIPSAWQYPEVACARIVLEDEEYKTDNYKETVWKQSSNIISDGEKVGSVEVCYLEERPPGDEGPFLKEERNVINAIAIEIGEVVGHTRDEKIVEAERQRFNDVLEVLPVYVVLLTPDYHVPFANRVFRERFGESYGRRCFECLFQRSEPCETCETYTVLRTMAPHEWEWVGPDGRNYHVFDFPFTDTDGSLLILEMGIDITDRKQAERELSETSLYARTLIEASLDPLVTISKDGKIMDVNSATEQVTGLYRGQLVGSDFSDYFAEPEKAREGYRRAFVEGLVRDYPLAIQHISGRITDVLYNATVYRNEAGEVQGVFAAARDVTERKRAQEALQESERELRYLSSQLMAAQETERKRIARDLHDGLGQLLTAIKFKVESFFQEMDQSAMKAKAKPLEAVIPMIQECVRESHRIQMNLRPSMLDDLGILATISWLCREFEATYPGIHIEREIDIQEEEILDSLKLVICRILQEGLNNIAKHSQAERVRISLGKSERAIELSVQDNGKGFDLQETLSAEGPKRGMGLSSMRERAVYSGGAFSVESAKGEGTRIRVSWPF